MYATNDARDRGPMPLELPLELPRVPFDRPRREGHVDDDPGRPSRIEIDFVDTEEDEIVRPYREPHVKPRHDDDADDDQRDRSRSGVIEISLV
jgi:hypothetical protein